MNLTRSTLVHDVYERLLHDRGLEDVELVQLSWVVLIVAVSGLDVVLVLAGPASVEVP